MKLDVMTKCGPINATGVDGEAVETFLNAYEDGDADVLRVPDGSETKTTLVDREAIVSVMADEDDEPEPEPEPEPEEPEVPAEPEETDAEAVEATEESSTR